MPAALPLAVRRVIQRRVARGQTAARIAVDLQLATSTVRDLVRRCRTQPEHLAPDYEHCGRPPDPARQPLVDATLALRREHPSWGAGLIRLHLPTLPKVARPGERTLSRWLNEAGLAPARAGRRTGTPRKRAAQPHAVWQMDASEQIPLATTQRVSWLRITDELSGAVLATTVFPPRLLGQGRSGRDARGVTSDLHALGFPRVLARG